MIKYLLFIFTLFSTFSCKQEMLGTGYAAKNFITSPIRAIKKDISNKQYKKMSKKMRQNKDEDQLVECNEKILKILSKKSSNNLENLKNKVRESACSCKAWGSCTKDICDCKKLCPKDTRLFKRHQNILENTQDDNSLAFRNPNSGNRVSDKFKANQGFCWGHASATSKFNRLAFFNNDSSPPFDLNTRDRKEQNKAINYYKKQIDKIMDNKTADIQGFKNLKEFSSHPAIQSYIGDKIAKEWANNAMTFQGLGTSLKSKPMSKEKNNQFVSKVKNKIDNHEQPQIVFTSSGYKFSTHTVLVSHYEKEGQKTLLCLRDNNDPPEENSNCQNKMYVNNEGKLFYDSSMWGEIGGAKIAHNDNQDAMAQISSLHKKCKGDKDCNSQ